MTNEQEHVELLSCPFCGGSPKIVERNVEPQGDPWYGHKYENSLSVSAELACSTKHFMRDSIRMKRP